MTDLARALLAEIDEDTVAALAERLRPHLAAHVFPAGLTVDEAGPAAGVSARTVRRALAAGLLEGELVAGRWRIAPEDLERWRAAGAPTVRAPIGAAAPGRAGAARRGAGGAGADAILGRVDSAKRGA